MPVASSSATLLREGEFYSPLQARLRSDDVLLSELRQPCSRSVPRHQHELALLHNQLERGRYSRDAGGSGVHGNGVGALRCSAGSISVAAAAARSQPQG